MSDIMEKVMRKQMERTVEQFASNIVNGNANPPQEQYQQQQMMVPYHRGGGRGRGRGAYGGGRGGYQEGKCYGCGKFGHYIAECTENQIGASYASNRDVNNMQKDNAMKELTQQNKEMVAALGDLRSAVVELKQKQPAEPPQIDLTAEKEMKEKKIVHICIYIYRNIPNICNEYVRYIQRISSLFI